MKRTNLYVIFSSVLLSAGLMSCAEENVVETVPASEIVTSAGHAMINGVRDTGSEHNAVVALYNPKDSDECGGKGIFCTGTLIHPQWVLTAAHCVADVEGSEYWWQSHSSYEVTSCARKMKIGVGNVETIISKRLYSVSEIYFHPTYGDRAVSAYYGTLDGDIALVKLSKPIPENVAKPILPHPEWLGVNDDMMPLAMEFSGFGFNEKGKIGTKRKFTGNITNYCGFANPYDPESGCKLGQVMVNGCHPAYTYQCYDHRTEHVLMPYGGLYYTQEDGGPCQGDSGGPAFIKIGGKEYVSGVTSYGDGACMAYGISTAVQDYYPWILSHAPEVASQYTEICDNGIDDDGNGLVDIDDSACSAKDDNPAAGEKDPSADDPSADDPAAGEKDPSADKPAAGEKDPSADDPAAGEKDPSADDPAADEKDPSADKPAADSETSSDEAASEPGTWTETFTGIGSDSNSYQYLIWESPETHVEWTISSGRKQLAEGGDDYSIDGEGIILKNGSLTAAVTGNVAGVSVQAKKAMKKKANRNVAIYVNNEKCGSAVIPADGSLITVECSDIKVSGDVKIQVKGNGAQITIDNVSWTTI